MIATTHLDETLRESDPAAQLARTIETLAEDLQAPIEISFRCHPGTSDVASVGVICSIPDAHMPAPGGQSQTAMAIADQVETWSKQLTAIAAAVRTRYGPGP